GLPIPKARLLVSLSRGRPEVGVDTLAQPKTVVGPPRAQAVLEMLATPAGSGLSRVTAKKRVTMAVGSMVPTGRRQRLPGAVEGQLQPGEELTASKVVWSGMTSVNWTPPSPNPVVSVAEIV